MEETKLRAPLLSTMANDAEMNELIEFYLEELRRKVTAVEKCLSDNDSHGIRMIAHQLKGSSVGYGFPTIGDSANTLESELMSSSSLTEYSRELTDQLLELCSRALMS